MGFKVHSQKQNEAHRIHTFLCALFCVTQILLLPLVYQDGYFNITETKAKWFVVSALVYIAFFAAVKLTSPQKLHNSNHTLYPEQICFIALTLAVLISTFVNGFSSSSFMGVGNRYQGLGMFLIYLALFFTAPDLRGRESVFIFCAAVSMTVTSVIAILNLLGFDPLGIINILSSRDIRRFISTFGNINFYGAFSVTMLPVFVYLFLIENKKRNRAVYSVLFSIGFMGAISSMSECAVLGFGAAVLIIPLFLRYDAAAMRRYPFILINMAVTLQFYSFLKNIFPNSWAFSELTQLLMKPVATAILLLAGIGMLFFFKTASDKTMRTVWRGYAYALCILVCTLAVVLFLANTMFRTVSMHGFEKWLVIDDDWGTDRGREWRQCLRFYSDFPFSRKLFGGGVGIIAALDTANRMFSDAVLDAAHNEYIQYLVTFGICGLLCYVGVIFHTFKMAAKQKDFFLTAILLGTISYLIQSTVNIAHPPSVSVFFVFLSVMARRGRKPEAISKKR